MTVSSYCKENETLTWNNSFGILVSGSDCMICEVFFEVSSWGCASMIVSESENRTASSHMIWTGISS
jgi:hypothetical protein